MRARAEKRAPDLPQEMGTAARGRSVLARRAASTLPLALFLALSAVALPDFEALPPMPESLRAFLGFGPSPGQISLALLVYSLSATLLTFGRLVRARRPEGGFSSLAYLTAFYTFYHFSGGTLENRLSVFVAGVTLLGLDCCNAWLWHGRTRDRLEGAEASPKD